jgi:hypothetical protein
MSVALSIALYAAPPWTGEVNLLFGKLSCGEPHFNLMNGALRGFSHNAAIINLLSNRNVAGGQVATPTGSSINFKDVVYRILVDGRTLLVQGAHYILGPFGEDSDLRRWGQKLAARGGKNGKKRAVVAVARKLAVLLHRLWVSGEVYEPLRNSQKAMSAAA